MANAHLRLPLLFLALMAATPLRAEDIKEITGEPLPQGAKVRLGGGGMVSRSMSFALLAPDYKVVVDADRTGSRVKRFDLATGRPLDRGEAAPLAGGGGELVLSADGKRFVFSHTGILTVRELGTGREVRTIRPPVGVSTVFTAYGSIALSNDGTLLAQNLQKGGKYSITIWDLAKGDVRAEVPTMQSRPTYPVFSPDGSLLLTHGYQPVYNPRDPQVDANLNRTAQIWNSETGKELFKAVASGGSSIAARLSGVAFSPDGKTLALSCGDGPIDLWSVPGGKLERTLLGRSRMGQRLAFSPDGKSLAALGWDGAVQSWTIADGKSLKTYEPPLDLPQFAPVGLAYAADGRILPWGTIGRTRVVWEATTGKLFTQPPVHVIGIRSIAFRAGGKEVLTSGLDIKVMRWEAATGKPIGELTLHSGRSLPSVALSPDGTRALSVGNPASLFDLTTGMELLAVPGGTSSGTSSTMTYSTDMRMALVVTSSRDAKVPGKCVVWDLVNQKRVLEVELPSSGYGLAAAALSPSGNRLVTAAHTQPQSGGGRAALIVTGWDLRTGKMLGQAQDTEAVGGQFHLAVASEMTAIIAAGRGRVRLYDYESGKGGDEVEPAGSRAGEGSCPIVFSPDRKRFAIATMEGTTYGVRVYDWPSAKQLQTFLGHSEMVTALAFSSDSKTLATASQDGSALLWDLAPIGK